MLGDSLTQVAKSQEKQQDVWGKDVFLHPWLQIHRGAGTDHHLTDCCETDVLTGSLCHLNSDTSRPLLVSVRRTRVMNVKGTMPLGCAMSYCMQSVEWKKLLTIDDLHWRAFSLVYTCLIRCIRNLDRWKAGLKRIGYLNCLSKHSGIASKAMSWPKVTQISPAQEVDDYQNKQNRSFAAIRSNPFLSFFSRAFAFRFHSAVGKEFREP